MVLNTTSNQFLPSDLWTKYWRTEIYWNSSLRAKAAQPEHRPVYLEQESNTAETWLTRTMPLQHKHQLIAQYIQSVCFSATSRKRRWNQFQSTVCLPSTSSIEDVRIKTTEHLCLEGAPTDGRKDRSSPPPHQPDTYAHYLLLVFGKDLWERKNRSLPVSGGISAFNTHFREQPSWIVMWPLKVRSFFFQSTV